MGGFPEGTTANCCEPDKQAIFQGYATWRAGRILKKIEEYVFERRHTLGVLERTYNDRKHTQAYEKALRLLEKIDLKGPGVLERKLEKGVESGLRIVAITDRCLYEDGKIMRLALQYAREDKEKQERSSKK